MTATCLKITTVALLNNIDGEYASDLVAVCMIYCVAAVSATLYSQNYRRELAGKNIVKSIKSRPCLRAPRMALEAPVLRMAQAPASIDSVAEMWRFQG